MSMIRTNKKMKGEGDFPTRAPRKDDFTEYVYVSTDGTQTVISRSELSTEIDELLYEELKAEANNNEVQIEKHRGYAKDQEKQAALLNMIPSDDDVEESVILKFQSNELREAIQSLQPQQQEWIFQKYIQDKSNTQIAREEDVTEGAIRDRFRKIDKQLKKKLEKKIK